MSTDEEKNERPRGKLIQTKSLWQFFRESPFVGLELEFERNKDISRDIDFGSVDGHSQSPNDS